MQERPRLAAPGAGALEPCHMYDMVLRMKTTLNIDDTVMAELKREAARQNRTMSELVETALRLLLASQRKRGESPPYRSSAAAEYSSMLPTAMPCTTPWKVASARR